jgi:DNA-directed RNA polymerase beta subunit
MNFGQVFESVLGWAGKKIEHVKFATPDIGRSQPVTEIESLDQKSRSCHILRFRPILYNGETGEQI